MDDYLQVRSKLACKAVVGVFTYEIRECCIDRELAASGAPLFRAQFGRAIRKPPHIRCGSGPCIARAAGSGLYQFRANQVVKMRVGARIQSFYKVAAPCFEVVDPGANREEV